MKYRRLIREAAGSIVAVSTALFGAAVANADPDPHIPDPIHDYCPGGGFAGWMYIGVCDGPRYPDGTYWHVQGVGYTILNVMRAAGTPGDINPPPAPPGGCGGQPVPDIPTHR
jgi:hypothetical protein